MLVPISYNIRSLFVRRSGTLLTVLGIGATVAVVSGVLALQQGFESMYTQGGREDLAVFLRPGATNEGDSIFTRERGLKLIKSLTEIRADEYAQPVASMECFLAVRRFNDPEAENYVRITIAPEAQRERLFAALREIVG